MAGHTIDFEAPNGTRLKTYGYHGITVIPPSAGKDLWWHYESREWVSHAEMRARRQGGSSHAPCRSYKAFLRHMRRHATALAGYKVVLCSRYIGHDVIAAPIQETPSHD